MSAPHHYRGPRSYGLGPLTFPVNTSDGKKVAVKQRVIDGVRVITTEDGCTYTPHRDQHHVLVPYEGQIADEDEGE